MDRAFSSSGGDQDAFVQFLLAHSSEIRSACGHGGTEDSASAYEDEQGQYGALAVPSPQRVQRRARRGRTSSRYCHERTDRNCQECGSWRVRLHEREGETVCDVCGTVVETHLSLGPFHCLPYADYVNAAAEDAMARRKGVYKRGNYFRDLLGNILDRKLRKVPEEALLAAKRGHVQSSEVTLSSVRAALKGARMGKYYCHTQAIVNIMERGKRREGGCSAEGGELDHAMEATMDSMFNRMQALFQKYEFGGRKNCLNYSYVFWQLFGYVGRPDLRTRLNMLKCKTRLQKHDKMWEEVCSHTGWPFVAVISQTERRQRQLVSKQKSGKEKK